MAILLKTRGTPLIAMWLKSPCAVLYEIARRAPGENIDLELGGEIFHLVQDHRAARHILRDNVDNYHKFFGEYETLFGQSRLTSEMPEWRRLRDYSQPYISAAQPDQIVAATRRFFSTAIDRLLESKSPDGSVNVDSEVDFAAASTISDTVLGFPMAQWGHSVLEDIRLMLRYASFLNFPNAGDASVEVFMLQADAEDAKTRLTQRFADAVEQLGGVDNGGLLAALAKPADIPLDLFGEIATLLFAGFDTTASCISWSLLLLAQDRELQDKLRKTVHGISSRDQILAEDLASLTDLQAFVHESMRIFPPIPILSRRVLATDEIDGWKLHGGNRVLLSIIGMHFNAKVFPEPSRVRLDRHPEGRPSREVAGAFLPFGDGRRVCPGARFANLEILAALALFLDRLDIAPSGRAEIDLRWDASLRREGGNRLKIAVRRPPD